MTIFNDFDHCQPSTTDGEDDYGWGCVYRNAQTQLAALGETVPSLIELAGLMGTGETIGDS